MNAVTIPVCISPRDFGDIYSAIQYEIDKYSAKFCSPTLGCIVNYTHVTSFKSGTVLKTNGSAMFNATFYADYFQPEIGGVYTATVFETYEQGIFAFLLNRIKVYIPSKYGPQSGSSKNIIVKIKDIRYKNNCIDCIGQMVNSPSDFKEVMGC
jgi:DNA-directed RNA polymerase subunit E'/Rpb7